MSRALLLLTLFLLGTSAVIAEEPPGQESGSTTKAAEQPGGRLRTDIEHMGRADLKGRRDWPERKRCADWLARRFKEAGLVPAPGQDSFHVDHGGTKAAPQFRHVVGWIPGTTPPDDSYVLVAAHYTGWGVQDGKVCPSANDNASGVAALLEIARALCKSASKTPRRGILFVAFDKYPHTTEGPDVFAKNPPLPLDRCTAMFDMEMVGRPGLGILGGYFFVVGTEHSELLEAAALEIGHPADGKLALIRHDFHLERSTYREFADRSIPFAFISGGLSLDRTSPKDTPDKIDYDMLAARAAWCTKFTQAAAESASRPTWRKLPPPQLHEMHSIRALLDPIRKEAVRLEADELMLRSIDRCIAELDAVIEKKTVEPYTRQKIVIRLLALMRQTINSAR